MVATRASFPLFQMIFNNFQEERQDTVVPSVALRSRVCKSIKEMDDYNMELVYAIIRCYHLQIDQRPIFENPYQMKKIKAFHFRFDIDNLPDDLVLILNRFIDMYEKQQDGSIPH